MIWLFFIYIVVLFVMAMLWYLYAKFIYKDTFHDTVLDHIKEVLVTVILSVLITLLLCYHPIYEMSRCSIKSSIMNTETKYSWIMGQCLAKNASGAFVDIERSRSLPSDDHVDNGSDH